MHCAATNTPMAKGVDTAAAAAAADAQAGRGDPRARTDSVAPPRQSKGSLFTSLAGWPTLSQGPWRGVHVTSRPGLCFSGAKA